MSTKRHFTRLACGFVLAVAFCLQVAAARQIRVECTHGETPAGKSALLLSINGVEVAALLRPGGASNAAVEQAMSRAAQRVALAYRSGELSFAAQELPDGRWGMMLNGELLLSASDTEARVWQHESAKTLAQAWARHAKQSLGTELDAMQAARAARASTAADSGHAAQPASLPQPESARLPQLAEPAERLVREKPEVSSAQPSPAVQADWAASLVISGGQKVYEPPAHSSASLPPNLSASAAVVTGNPSTQEAARRALEALLRSALGLDASSALSWKAVDPQQLADSIAADSKKSGKAAGAGKAGKGKPAEAAELPEPNLRLTPGAERKVSLNYKSGSDEGTLELLLQNRGINPPRESLTFFSNVPEGVTRQQLLYFASLPAGQSARLVFHHQNQGSARLKMCARAVNEGREPALLHVIPGSCNADENTFWVGFKSAESFWNNLNNNSGYALSIPAGGQALIAMQDLPPAATSSGYYKLSSLSGSDLLIETLVLNPGAQLPGGRWPDGRGASTAVYPEPYVSQNAVHTVGGDWTYLRLGVNSPESISGGGAPLYGSYGMTYSYNVSVDNPSSSAGGVNSNVYVVLRGSAGEVKGQVYINDEYIASPLVSGGGEQLLKVFTLAPGESRNLKIRAIALNGGFYPASIILRETRDP